MSHRIASVYLIIILFIVARTFRLLLNNLKFRLSHFNDISYYFLSSISRKNLLTDKTKNCIRVVV